MPRPSTRERRSDSRVGVEEGRCPIQDWIVSRIERGRSPIASRFNWDKEVKDSGLVWFLLDNGLNVLFYMFLICLCRLVSLLVAHI